MSGDNRTNRECGLIKQVSLPCPVIRVQTSRGSSDVMFDEDNDPPPPVPRRKNNLSPVESPSRRRSPSPRLSTNNDEDTPGGSSEGNRSEDELLYGSSPVTERMSRRTKKKAKANNGDFTAENRKSVNFQDDDEYCGPDSPARSLTPSPDSVSPAGSARRKVSAPPAICQQFMESVAAKSQKESKKQREKERKLARDAKRRCADTLQSCFSNKEKIHQQLKTLNVTAPGRYKSIRSFHQDSQDEGDGGASSGRSSPSRPSRSVSADPDRHSERNDRDEFYRHFQILIRAGNTPAATQQTTDSFVMRGRRGSQIFNVSDQKHKHATAEFLWLNLQAFFNGFPMNKAKIHQSVQMYDTYLIGERNQKKEVLREIGEFSFGCRPSLEATLACLTMQTPVSKDDANFNLSDVDESLADNYYGATSGYGATEEEMFPAVKRGEQEIFSGAFLIQQQQALDKVFQLLTKFENFQSLYPTTKTMEQMLANEWDERLRDRLNVLYVWYNVTEDLCRKCRDVGHMLGMDNRNHDEGQEDDGDIDWPNLDFETPKNLSPPDSDDEQDESDEVSSPGGAGKREPALSFISITSAVGSLSQNLSRATSAHEIISTAVMYKKFVEKSLRLRGMRKILKRLGSITSKTLSKARKALEVNPVSTRLQSEEPSQISEGMQRRSVMGGAVSSSGGSGHRWPEYGSSSVDSEAESASPSGSLLNQSSAIPRISLPLPLSPSITLIKKSADAGYPIFRTPVEPSAIPYSKELRQFSRAADPDLMLYGVNHELFKETNLPSFYPSFLFLLRVPLDLVHEWLKLRVDQQIQREPDFLALNTLIQDCHDCLEAAVEVKCFYQEYVQATTLSETQLDKLLVKDMQEFEHDLKRMFMAKMLMVDTKKAKDFV